MPAPPSQARFEFETATDSQTGKTLLSLTLPKTRTQGTWRNKECDQDFLTLGPSGHMLSSFPQRCKQG